MNKWAKMLLKSFVIGGAICVGVSINSTNSKAAEIELNDEQLPTEDISEDEETQVTGQTDERIQTMEDATQVIEGDVVAEEGYCNQAKSAAENDELSQEKSAEIKNSGEDVLNQAKEKIESVRNAYAEITSETESVKAEVKAETEGTALEWYSKKLEAVEGTEQKIDYLNELSDTADRLYQDFVKEHGKDSEEYNRLIVKIHETENNKEKLYEEYSETLKEYEYLEKQYKEILEEINSFEGNLDEESVKEKAEYYNQQLDELNRLREEFEQSCSKFDEVYYSRQGIEKRVAQAESNKKQGLEKVKEVVINNTSEDELVTIVLESSKNIEEYNRAVEEMDRWFSDLEYAINERQGKKLAYDKQQEVVKNLTSEQGSSTRYEELIEKSSESKKLLAEFEGKVSGYEAGLDSFSKTISELYAFRDSLDSNIIESDRLYNIALQLIDNYKTVLKNVSEAQQIYDRAEKGYKVVTNSYYELTGVIEAYNTSKEEIDIIESYRKMYEEIYGMRIEAEGYYLEAKKAYENNSLTEEEYDEIIGKLRAIYQKITDESEDLQYREISLSRAGDDSGFELRRLEEKLKEDKEIIEFVSSNITCTEEDYQAALKEYEEVTRLHGDAISIYEFVITEEAKLKSEIRQLEAEKNSLKKGVDDAKTEYEKRVSEYNAWRKHYEENQTRIKDLEKMLETDSSEKNLDMYKKALDTRDRIVSEMKVAEEKKTNSLKDYNIKKGELSTRMPSISSQIDDYNHQIEKMHDTNASYIEEYEKEVKEIVDRKKFLEKELEELKKNYEKSKLDYEEFVENYPRYVEEDERKGKEISMHRKEVSKLLNESCIVKSTVEKYFDEVVSYKN